MSLPANPIFSTDPSESVLVMFEKLTELGCSEEYVKQSVIEYKARLVKIADAYEGNAMLTGRL